MTNLTNDALSKAIEALEEAKLRITELCICHSHPAPTATIERVEEALSTLSTLSQEARPVAVVGIQKGGMFAGVIGRSYSHWQQTQDHKAAMLMEDVPVGALLYAHPKPAQPQLSDEEIARLWDAQRKYHGGEPCKVAHLEFARALLSRQSGDTTGEAA